MSHQAIADAFAPADAQYHEQVMQSTWGHLAPARDKAYYGHVVFAIGCYDELNPLLLEANFKGLPDSPWFFEALTDLIQQETEYGTSRGARHKWKPGGTYRWEGKFHNYTFVGSFRRLKVEASRPTVKRARVATEPAE